MAAIVASTLRRRTMQQKQSELKMEEVELGPLRTPSFYRNHPPLSPITKKYEKILIEDFWPECFNPEESDVSKLEFTSFETLVPRVNFWLKEKPDVDILKCETIERKLTCLNDLDSDSLMSDIPTNPQAALFVRGLRMWCVYRRPQQEQQNDNNNSKTPNNKRKTHEHSQRQQHLQNVQETSLTNNSQSQKDSSQLNNFLSQQNTPQQQNTQQLNTPQQQHTQQHNNQPQLQQNLPENDTLNKTISIGFLNVVPKCQDTDTRNPRYEELPETYAAINNYMLQTNFQGKILAIETLPIKTPISSWNASEVDPDITFQAAEKIRKHHVVLITRIFFVYGTFRTELIGAQDFLPDFLNSSSLNCSCQSCPSFKCLSDAFKKASKWTREVRNIRIVNVQTLETIYILSSDSVRTGRNFMGNASRYWKVRFVRINYTSVPTLSSHLDVSEVLINGESGNILSKQDPPNGVTKKAFYKTPSDLTYKTFMPSVVKVGMCTGSPEYESFSSVWLRLRAWLQRIDRKVINVETISHPLRLAWDKQDGAETSCLPPTNSKEGTVRYVQLIRVYLDGSYTEPPSDELPMLPPVEEVNDCFCSIC